MHTQQSTDLSHGYDRQNERVIARQPILVPMLQGGPPMFEPRHGPQQRTFLDLIRFNPNAFDTDRQTVRGPELMAARERWHTVPIM